MSEEKKDGWFSILRHPSAFAPMLMSLFALAVVIINVARFGAVREPDEGAAAHIWQLLMAAQLPIIVFFLARWLRRAPRAALSVLGLQVAAACAAVAPVYFWHL